MMKKFFNYKKYWSVWKIVAVNTLQVAFVNKGTNSLFFIGKLIRFSMTLLFLFLLKQNVKSFGTYSTDEMIIFFLTHQFIDVLSQTIYRGVYIFSNLIRRGDFDFYLSKPINPLFRALTGLPDINDAIFIVPTTLISIFIATQLDLNISIGSLLIYLFLLLNSLIISTALHILILAVGIIITDVDGVIWMYRDFMRFGQFPISIYMEPFRFILSFIIPVGIMISIPAEILLQLSSAHNLAYVLVFGILFFIFSLFTWNWSLKRYSSASS